MDYDRFITLVEQATGLDRVDAENATRAALQTLAERLDKGEARDLAAQLPAELAPWISTTTPSQKFDLDEFLRRLAQREGVDVATAERHARAVFAALGRAVTPDEIEDVAAQLPREFAPLLPRGRRLDAAAGVRFADRVAQHAGIDLETAGRASDAVLETLAERIAGGEVDDLIARLPVDAHPPLKRGAAQSGETARRMGVEEFIQRTAEREGVSLPEAALHTRAVFATLRELIPDAEFFDVTVQLPAEYRVLLAQR